MNTSNALVTFKTSDLSKLYNSLPENLQNIIKIFFLGLGSPLAKCFLQPFNALNASRIFYEDQGRNIDDLTMWRYKRLANPRSALTKTPDTSYRGSGKGIKELCVAFNKSDLCFFSQEVKTQNIITATNSLNNSFKTFQERINEPIQGTPTARVIRSKYFTIQRFLRGERYPRASEKLIRKKTGVRINKEICYPNYGLDDH